MRITDVGLKREGDFLVAEAKLEWEDCDKAPLVHFVQVSAEFEDFFCADANGFLLAALHPAWTAGERRIHVDGRLCGILSSRSRAALLTLRAWFPQIGSLPVIEASQGFGCQLPSQTRSASFLSCGIDSLATLRWNVLNVDRMHPAAIWAGIMVDYIEGHGWSVEQEGRETARRFRAATNIAADVGIAMIAARTNILALHRNRGMFAYQTHGAVLSSVAYFLSKGFSRAYIASSDSPGNFTPWGSHPLLDPYYSGAHLAIEHDGVHMNRFEKSALVSDWPVALDNILVCTRPNYAGLNNCGTCEKCLRTMTALVALNRLSQCGSFPASDVSAESMRALGQYVDPGNQVFYRELLAPLRSVGRVDLSEAIEEWLAPETDGGDTLGEVSNH